jgi:nicotinate-nucleotide pyrophosphorylase (carboxylating)
LPPRTQEPPPPTLPAAFGPDEAREAAWLIERALEEDLPAGDRTTSGLFGRGGPGDGAPPLRAAFAARSRGVLCGLPVIEMLFRSGAPGVALHGDRRDGHVLAPGERFLEAVGEASAILPLERIALNFLQRLSGVATETARWVEALAGTGVRLLDTRKTTPGWRRLEKYAVRAGGGENHRMSLADGILLKDNHRAALAAAPAGRLRDWVEALRRASPGVFLQVEVDGRDELLEALDARPDAILLDNFPLPDLAWAVEARNRRGPGAPGLEASGGIRLENVRAVAASGVERISVGALTHSAPALDIGLDVIGAREGAT